MVFQHFSLFEALNVAENVALGMENPPPHAASWPPASARSAKNYGLPLDPDRLVGDLSAGERQRVEIIRCLLAGPEAPDHGRTDQRADPAGGGDPLRDPAAAFGRGHRDPLHQPQAGGDPGALRRGDDPAPGQGGGDLHPAREVRARDGRADGGRRRCTPPERRAEARRREVALEVAGLSVASPNPVRDDAARTSASRSARARCWASAGVAGNGQDELAAGAVGRDSDRADGGADRRHRLSAISARTSGGAPGLVAAPEERLGHAAAPDMSLTENALLTGLIREGLTRNGFVDWGETRSLRRRHHQGLRRAHAGRRTWRRGRCRAATCRNS